MKLFIVTLNNKSGDPHEFLRYSCGLADMAIVLHNIGVSIRTIEEIPNDPKAAEETGLSWDIPYEEFLNCPSSFE